MASTPDSRRSTGRNRLIRRRKRSWAWRRSPTGLRGSAPSIITLRETLVGTVPVLSSVLVVALLAREVSLAILLLAFGVGALAAFAIARVWVSQARAFATWIDRLSGESDADQSARPPVAFFSGVEWLIWPTIDLARRLRRVDRRVRARDSLIVQIVEISPDPILLIDEDMIVRQLNAAAKRTFDIPDPPLPLWRVLRDPGVVGAVEGAIVDGVGDQLVFSPVGGRSQQLFGASVQPVQLPDETAGAMIMLRERTEQLMVERMRSDFVANASHELKTPLSAIIGFIETLRGPARDDPEGRAMFLDIMDEEAQRMSRLVEDLLSLSQIERQENLKPSGSVDMSELLPRIVEAMSHGAGKLGCVLELEVEDDLQPVRGDPDQLYELVSNLVDNAIKYGQRGGRVIIKARMHEDAAPFAGNLTGRPCLEIAVTDFGEGIAPEHIDRLTERFYRVDKARSRKIGGTGLGLAIAKHIVRRHDAHLGIESELGVGSTFRVLLPFKDQRHERASA